MADGKKIAGGIAAIVAAAVAIALPETRQSEGTVLHAYRDDGGVWSICNGRTKGVHAGQTATLAQCEEWLREDLAEHTAAALAFTPTLAEQPSVLAAAGDFSYNAGDGWWRRSPMARYAARRQWLPACNAFTGYVVLYKAPRVIPGRHCRRNSKGVLYCELPGLVERRKRETRDCLKGLKP